MSNADFDLQMLGWLPRLSAGCCFCTNSNSSDNRKDIDFPAEFLIVAEARNIPR